MAAELDLTETCPGLWSGRRGRAPAGNTETDLIADAQRIAPPGGRPRPGLQFHPDRGLPHHAI